MQAANTKITVARAKHHSGLSKGVSKPVIKIKTEKSIVAINTSLVRVQHAF